MFFLPQVDEFMVHSFLRPLDDMKLYDGDVLIIWKWTNVVCDKPSIEQEDESSIEENSSPEDFDEEMVTFKVIGNLRETSYQSILRVVSERLHKNEDVPVKLVPEPNNPYDNKAFAFMCTVDGGQHRIGYVVRECLDAVHDALSKGLLKSTKFAWCKYRPFNGNLGFYAAVNITKFGKWPNEVHRSRST